MWHYSTENRGPGLGTLLALAVVASAPFFVLAGIFDTFPGDEEALLAFQGLGQGWLDLGLGLVTRTGDPWVATVLACGAALALLLTGRWVDGVTLGLAQLALLANFGIKELVARPRPEYLIAGLEETSFSFPSGHSVFAVCFIGMLVYLAGGRIPHTGVRRAVRVVLVAWALTLGASRVYLGAHWPSDVVGGFLLGSIFLVGVIWMMDRLTPNLTRWL